MRMKWKNVIEQDWLAENLDHPELVLADCRFALADPELGRRSFEAGRLPKAQYFDLDNDLSSPIGPHGGRHPLPEQAAFTKKLQAAGIDSDSLVVAYDNQFGAMAARFWWLLRYYGHDNVKIMNGTYDQWVEQGYPTSRSPYAPEQGSFVPKLRPSLLAHVQDVRDSLNASKTILVDAREAVRFSGSEEPIDPIAGRIPGAMNFFWRQTTDEAGLWNVSPLAKALKGSSKDDNIIVYCGSGVTACPVVLGLGELGFERVRLYAGSWSDWITFPELPRAADPKNINP